MRPEMATSKRQVELDFIRGVAILAVLDYHFAAVSLLWKPFARFGIHHFGWIGVDLFFVLSGFLVGGLLMKEWKTRGRIEGGRFLKRRAFKIWPSYYFFLLVVVVLRVHPLKTFLVGNLLNIQNYTGTSLPHTWSLAVEEHFYLLLTALLVWWASSKRTPRALFFTLLWISLADVVLRYVLAFFHLPTEWPTHSRLDALLWGVMLALLYHFYPHRFVALQQRVWPLLLITAASFVGLCFFPDPWFATGVTIANVGCVALFLLLYRRRDSHSWLYRAVAWIGVYSYGIYLWHLSVRAPLARLEAHAPAALLPLLVHLAPYVCAIVIGVLMTKLVEFPMLRLRERVVPPTTPQLENPTLSSAVDDAAAQSARNKNDGTAEDLHAEATISK